MLRSIRVIAGDMRNIYFTTVLNAFHLILKGMPFGILLLVVLELLKPKSELDISRLIFLFTAIGIPMLINLFLAIKVHVRAYISSYNLSTETRLALGDHLRKLSLGFFKQRDPGDISALLLQDMAKVEMVFSNFFIDAIACIILPLMMAVFFFIVDWRMALLMISSVVLALPALWGAQKLIGYFGKRHVVSRNLTSSRLLEYLEGIKVIMAFNLTGKNFKRLDRIMRKLCNDSIKLEAAASAPIQVYMTILDLGFVSLLVLGVHFLLQGEISIPIFLMFLVIGYKFFEPLISFGAFISEIRYMNIAASRITDVMDTPPLKEPDKSQHPKTFDIEFNNVSFGYTETRVLKDVTARFPENSITALVGPSGSGKTTITSLIARFWDVNEGGITIGGIDIRQIPTEALHCLISVVFQDVYLFQDSIFNNIRVGKKNASKEEVMGAAKTAQCHEFIQQMENGYDTIVGEGGSTLSGGEKQRISIARALLKDAPIVLLDEATASLDPENELLIQKAIGEMVKSKTLIVIAHRLKTIARADQILVIDQGAVAEKGDHETLLANDQLYARLWNEQHKAGGWKFKGFRQPASQGEHGKMNIRRSPHIKSTYNWWK
ncbi:ABC transporter ATP-binding protein [Desulfobacter sp.]|uniref:ABC transporter ATP-binding protein n=1 Tax=Desulfobacter sp. TaxID=2294 RepID=UPI003D09D8C9